MNVFSCRAEGQCDVDSLQNLCATSGITLVNLRIELDRNGFADVEVEFESSATLETLRETAKLVVDGYVLLQTLRQVPLAENSLKRDRSLW